ncbi:Type I acyl-CoA thioesterase mpaH [Cladobotryum mycophilum]|uniref:Type I acyl-CoA thioesterase mpaH n=1 Tax=Cladobotryum mycophilum TaxID=491253 RepID=A0ABR0SS42_9HYPO
MAPSTSSVFDIVEHTIEATHIREYPQATANSQDEPLLLHIKQYIPKNPSHPPRKGDLTIIGSHANGFPKELYEPLWEDFYHECEKLGVGIRAIWIADCAWQGQSGVLNETRLGNDPSWIDYARDILHAINTFRMPRPLLAIGHSFGANALTNAALIHPRLFSGMVLLDPVIARFRTLYSNPAVNSVNRRDVWPSRQAALASFSKNPFYKLWDPRALHRWAEFGLRDDPNGEEGQGQVKLTTTKHQEVFTFLRPLWPAFDESGTQLISRRHMPDMIPDEGFTVANHPVYRPEGVSTLKRLPHLRPGVLYIFGGKSDKLETTGVGEGGSGGAKEGRVKSVTEPEAGHLVPLENPGFCAQAAAEWAKTEVDRWWEEEREFEEWSKKPAVEKVTVSEEFRKRIGAPPPRNGNGKNKAKI